MDLGIFSAYENKKVKRWYSILNHLTRLRNQDFDFLNLGYFPIDIEENDKYNFISNDFKNNITNRQELLYYSLLENMPKGLQNIAEIGSGFGGGARILNKYFHPQNYFGFDVNRYSIDKCNRKFKGTQNFVFKNSDYQNFIKKGTSYDAIVSLEASLHFEDVSIFYKNVRNSLPMDGHFYYGDIFENDRITAIEALFKQLNLKITNKRDVTEQVVNSIYLTGKPSRLNSILHKFFLGNDNLDFSVDTKMYKKLKNRECLYLFYEIVKY